MIECQLCGASDMLMSGEGGGGVGRVVLLRMDDEVAVCGWQTDCIARIDPISGRVKAWLYLATLRCGKCVLT